ncbi:hypothetical protein SG34_015815 [Thalassomonas viridans]|uniref:Uncharacterized protein n=2 Tax=Thalassomonas viridans TaxID=137584 RepID=A0AAF0C7J1_9GAMM|nr:hypothetical protein SG34_015815 [Thalassomonas viridans]
MEQLTQQAEQELVTASGQTAVSAPSLLHAYGDSGQTPATFDAMKLEEHEYTWLLLSHFLNHGTLPWYVDATQFTGITATVELLISKGKLDIPAFKHLLNNETVVKRLITQLDGETLEKLYACATGVTVYWPDLFHELQQCLNQASTATNSSTNQQTSPQKPSQYHTELSAFLTQKNLHQAWKIIWSRVSEKNDLQKIFSLILKQISDKLTPDIVQSFSLHLLQSSRIKAITGNTHQNFLTALENIIPPLKESAPSTTDNIRNQHLSEQSITASSPTNDASKISSPGKAGRINDVHNQQANQPTEEKAEKLSPVSQTNNLVSGTENTTDKPQNSANTNVNEQLDYIRDSSQTKKYPQERELSDVRQQEPQPADTTNHTDEARPEDKATKQSDGKKSPTEGIQKEINDDKNTLMPESASTLHSPLKSEPSTSQKGNKNLSEPLFPGDNAQAHSRSSSHAQDAEQTLVTTNNQNSRNINNSHNLKQNKQTYINQDKNQAEVNNPTQTHHQQEIPASKAGETNSLFSGKTILNGDAPTANESSEKSLPQTRPPCFVPEAASQGLAVENAGLVIFWPYLHIYFKDLGLFDGKDFKNLNAREKAVHLLQYLATGEVNTEEHALTLNKLLCHWDFNQPLSRFVSLSNREREESEKLINAVINHWSVLGKTSIDSFRSTFIQRKGLLNHQDNGWLLRVEKGPYDILLDRIPWGLSMIKLSWVDELLQVEW